MLGIFAGSWSNALAARIPTGTRVAIRTDHDDNGAGDRYAELIARSLAGRCELRRTRKEPVS